MQARAFLIVAVAVFSFSANAETPPVPKSKTETIGTLKDRLDKESKEKEELTKHRKKLFSDLEETKRKLIKTAALIRNNEEDLKDYEKRIASLELKKSVLEDKLHADRASISKLIIALERIRRTPPEALLAKPDTPYQTAQSAMLMGRIVPSVNRHAEKLNKNLQTLERVSKDLKVEKSELLATSESLLKQHKELSELIEKRKDLYAKTDKNIKARDASIQKISLQAKNLEDLVKKIQEEEKRAEERNKAKQAKKPKPRVKSELSGGSYLPVSGVVRTGYNQKDDLGAKSKGLSIEGRAGALVVSPMDGQIQFAGAFKRYGNIVVIEHADGYHSLVAGLDQISSIVGDHVKSGEPIGVLPNSSLIPRPTLYYELRKNGQPVNPAVKFPDLG